MKLTIENYKKIENSFNWATWGIQKVEETNTQYHFELRNSYGEVIDIQLERSPTYGNSKTQFQYEFWGWRPHKGTTRPEREFLYFHQVKDKRLFSTALCSMIRKWTNG